VSEGLGGWFGFAASLLILAPLSGCAGSVAVRDPAPVIAAFRDTLATYYEEKRLREQESYASSFPPRHLAERRARAGARLIEALERVGYEVSRVQAQAGLSGIAPRVERFVHRHTELTFGRVDAPRQGQRIDANAYPGSFLIAEDVTREVRRPLRVAGIEADYHRIAFRRMLCPPYEAWLGERAGAAGGPGVFWAEGVVYLDQGRLERSADALLFDRVDALRGALARARKARGGQLAREAADALRWRAVEPLVLETARLAGPERAARFARARGEELTELTVCAAVLGTPREGVSGMEQHAAALIAVLDGRSPTGALATIVQLHAQGRSVGSRALFDLLSALEVADLDWSSVQAKPGETSPEELRLEAAAREAVVTDAMLRTLLELDEERLRKAARRSALVRRARKAPGASGPGSASR
jgi:hypothetical protein